MYIIMLSTNSGTLSVYFYFGFLLYLLLPSCSHGIPILCGTIVVRVFTHDAVHLILEDKLSVSPLGMMLAVGLVYMAFIMMRYISSHFCKSIDKKWMLNLVKCISGIKDMIMNFVFLFLQ